MTGSVPILSDATGLQSVERKWKPWGITLTTLFGAIILVLAMLAQIGVILLFLAPHMDSLVQAVSNAGSRDEAIRGVVALLTDLVDVEMMSVSSMIAMGLTAVLATVLFVRMKRRSTVYNYLCLNSVPWRTLWLWVGIAMVYFIAIHTANAFLGVDELSESFAKGPYKEIASQSELSLLAIAVIIVVSAPIWEEVFFRGFLIRGYLGIAPSTVRVWAVIIVTSLIFAGLHFQYSLIVMVEISILGILIGLARVRTNSLFTCITMHATANAIPFAMIAFA